MRYGTREFDMRHALTAYLGLRYLDAAFLANDTAMLEALVLSAQALVVLDRTEYLGAEKAIAFRLERPIVDGLRLLHLAKRPGPHHVRRRQSDANGLEIIDRVLIFEQLQQIFH